MDHTDHVRLLHEGVADGRVWADLGSGSGAFTLALADLLGTGGVIYSVDKDAGALARQERAMRAGFPAVETHYRVADFTVSMDLPPLDGMVMANALHFHRRKETIVGHLRGYLKPGGRFLLVEYNTDRGNRWVPHPLSFSTWEGVAGRSGLVGTRWLTDHPSRFLGQIYSALSFRPDSERESI